MKHLKPRPWTAGHAPACWQDNIAQQATRVKKLHHFCAWVQPLAETVPKLRQGPLLGDCLTGLTDSSEATSAHADERPRAISNSPIEPHSSQRPPAQTRGDAGRLKTSSTATSMPHTGVTESLKLAQHVDRAQLRRMAGTSPLEEDKHTVASHPSTEPLLEAKVNLPGADRNTAARQRLQPTASSDPQRSPPHQNVVSIQALRETQHVWLERLARRALHSQSLLRDSSALTAVVMHWNEPLDGQTISLSVLTQLTERRPRSHEAERGRQPPDRSTPSAAASAPASADRSIGRGESIGQATNRSVVTPALDLDREQNRSAAQARETEQDRLRGASSAFDMALSSTMTYAPEANEPAHVAPPAIAQVMPQLLPPQTVRASSPPVATNLAERGAEREAQATEVDLVQLAANVKRILDEEARRYGIDV